MDAKKLVLLLGMGRSGTSALTRVLSLCGCGLPDKVVGAADINPKGSWEPIDARAINDRIMRSHGSGFMDPSLRLQHEISYGDDEREQYVQSILAFLARCPTIAPLVIKELNVTELMDLWLEAAKRGQFDVCVVVPFRHPREVFRSLAALLAERDLPLSEEYCNAVWTRIYLLAERRSRSFPRVFVDYSNLLIDWRKEIARISSALSIQLQPNSSAVACFLDQGLHRQRDCGPIADAFSYSWTSRVYASLCAAAKDQPIDPIALDEIYSAYRANERTFRIAGCEFKKLLDWHASQSAHEAPSIWNLGRDF